MRICFRDKPIDSLSEPELRDAFEALLLRVCKLERALIRHGIVAEHELDPDFDDTPRQTIQLREVVTKFIVP